MGREKDRSLSHLDEAGKARMVDVAGKAVTRRRAVAEGFVALSQETFEAIRDLRVAKGNVLETARIAGIQGAKRCADLIPLCHPLPLDFVDVRFEEDAAAHRLRIVAEAQVDAKTGVEMEAMTAVAVAALTVYDMVKGMERGVTLGPFRLLEKSGGRSGTWKAT